MTHISSNRHIVSKHLEAGPYYRKCRFILGFARPPDPPPNEGNSKGSRSGFLAKCFFEGLGYQGQKPHMFEKRAGVWPCRLRRHCQKNSYVLVHVWFLGLGTPGPQKTTWPNNHLDIRLIMGFARYLQTKGIAFVLGSITQSFLLGF
jgi:hypothetical protein